MSAATTPDAGGPGGRAAIAEGTEATSSLHHEEAPLHSNREPEGAVTPRGGEAPTSYEQEMGGRMGWGAGHRTFKTATVATHRAATVATARRARAFWDGTQRLYKGEQDVGASRRDAHTWRIR